MPYFRLIAITFFSFAQLSLATQFSSHPHSKARLIANYDGVHNDKVTTLALHIKLDPGWHSYWKNPGDSGAAPIINFKPLPELDISGTLFPIPKRIEVPPLMTFGYESEVMYLFEVKRNSKSNRKSAIKINMEAEWLVCKIECIPAFGDFQIELPFLNHLNPSKYHSEIETYRYKLPLTENYEKIEARENTSSNSIDLVIKTLSWKNIDFFPIGSSKLELSTPVVTNNQEKEIRISLKKGIGYNSTKVIKGLLVYTHLGFQKSSWIDIPIKAPNNQDINLVKILLFAFLGGLLLNLMPCVFPVIFIKLFGLIKHADGRKALIRGHCAAYILGVVFSFLVLAGLLITLKAGGILLGWGFQLQSPEFLTILSLLFIMMALGFLGAYSIEIPIGSKGTRLMSKDGFLGQFLTGVLSTIVASPCTAPFMGFAMGAAISQSPAIILATFALLGLGLGAPYLAIMIHPSSLKLLPKPGKWMESIKQFMAFPLFLTALWLLWILGQVAESEAIIKAISGYIIIGLGYWIYSHFGKTKLAILVGVLGCIASIFWVSISEPLNKTSMDLPNKNNGVQWQLFSKSAIEVAKSQGKPVFVNYTADWCITCKVNERVTFFDKDIQDFIKQNKIVMIKADWTRRDQNITKMLMDYNRIGVPLYLYWQPGAQKAKVLPEVLTPGIFIDEIGGNLDPKQ